MSFTQSGNGKTQMDAMRVLLAEIDREERDLLGKRAETMREVKSAAESTMIVGGLLALVLSVTLGVWITRSITVPLTELVSVTERLAQGDLTLTVDADTKDEVGMLKRAVHGLVASLREVVSQVSAAATNVASGAEEMSTTAQTLSEGAAQQSSSAEQTSSSMEEMTSSIQQNADNARQTDMLAAKAAADTRVPTAPPYMRGVVNVRGSAIPVVDLRRKLGLQSAVDDVHTRILVLELDVDGERTIIGALADSVRDVVEIDPQEMVEPPRIAMRWRSELIDGMAKHADQFVMILNIVRVFASDVVALDAAAATVVEAAAS